MKVVILSLLAASAAGFTVIGNNAATRSSTSLSMSAALIVQNKGGGHGELGFQLAKTLAGNDKITSITILQDDACKDTTEPFKSYASDLPDVKVVKASLGDDSMTSDAIKELLGGSSFEYVWDNASKGVTGAGKAVIDCAKEWDVKLLTYISSAGCYLPDGTFPMPETTPVKDSAGQVQYENYATEQGLPFCSFRPQYIYGPKSNKWDYIDWYFDRIVRDLPLPIPGDGTQKVSLTNSEDVASIFASVLNDEAAATEQRIFNCGTDNLVSYSEVAELCAEVAGKKANIHYYDADKFGKAKFPFRLTDFYVAPDMVKSKLGWSGAKTTLKEDLVWYFESYKARGGDTKSIDFEKDLEIVGQKS
jgi:nucleoside-diphosphate-sugar epimerase